MWQLEYDIFYRSYWQIIWDRKAYAISYWRSYVIFLRKRFNGSYFETNSTYFSIPIGYSFWSINIVGYISDQLFIKFLIKPATTVFTVIIALMRCLYRYRKSTKNDKNLGPRAFKVMKKCLFKEPLWLFDRPIYRWRLKWN